MKKGKKILVVEKHINPLYNSTSENDISNIPYSIAYFYGEDNVDTVWSLSKHKFENFEMFFTSELDKLKSRAEERMNAPCNINIKSIIKELYEEKIQKLESAKKLLRKTTINSIEDLSIYSLFILHPDTDDCINYLSKIKKIYSKTPIIIPSGSIASSWNSNFPNIYVQNENEIMIKVKELLGKPLIKLYQ